MILAVRRHLPCKIWDVKVGRKLRITEARMRLRLRRRRLLALENRLGQCIKRDVVRREFRSRFTLFAMNANAPFSVLSRVHSSEHLSSLVVLAESYFPIASSYKCLSSSLRQNSSMKNAYFLPGCVPLFHFPVRLQTQTNDRPVLVKIIVSSICISRQEDARADGDADVMLHRRR